MVFKLILGSALAVAARDLSVFAGTSRTPPLIANDIPAMTLKDAPIEPSWIVSGEPRARSVQHSRGADDAAMTAVWDCTAGRFRWFFHWEETVIILEGEVHVLAEDGTERTLKKGDIAYFKGGTWTTWTIDSYVKKVAFVRKPFPTPLAFALRLKNLLRGGRPGGGLAA